MNSIIDANTQANHTRLAHTIGISIYISHAIGHLGLGNASAHTARSTQDNLSAWSHATVTHIMSTCSNTGCVGSMSSLKIGRQCVDLFAHENRA